MDVEQDEVNQRQMVFKLEQVVTVMYSYGCWCGHGTSAVFSTSADALASWKKHCEQKHSYKIQPL